MRDGKAIGRPENFKSFHDCGFDPHPSYLTF